MTNYNQHSPSVWSRKKRERVKEIKAENALRTSNEVRITEVINIAAKYIKTSDMIEFSREVQEFLNEH